MTTTTAHRALIVAGTVTAAVAVNLILWLIGKAAGATFTYLSNGETFTSTPILVIAETAVPLAAGLTLATLAAVKWPRIIPAAQMIGVLLATVTAAGALLTDFDSTASRLSLALMHVVVAAAVFLGLRAISQTLQRRALSPA
ncbi:DUF6069 family protein [Nocardia yamanashiensis]|uniref:DUF6069 family protein n=1 Tax=Nocardia yamanashiensis TaxID=209247 RepID=UPI00082FB4C5|nr:DUF6069 family protein [Nocardia yamanashiensis]